MEPIGVIDAQFAREMYSWGGLSFQQDVSYFIELRANNPDTYYALLLDGCNQRLNFPLENVLSLPEHNTESLLLMANNFTIEQIAEIRNVSPFTVFDSIRKAKGYFRDQGFEIEERSEYWEWFAEGVMNGDEHINMLFLIENLDREARRKLPDEIEHLQWYFGDELTLLSPYEKISMGVMLSIPPTKAGLRKFGKMVGYQSKKHADLLFARVRDKLGEQGPRLRNWLPYYDLDIVLTDDQWNLLAVDTYFGGRLPLSDLGIIALGKNDPSTILKSWDYIVELPYIKRMIQEFGVDIARDRAAVYRDIFQFELVPSQSTKDLHRILSKKRDYFLQGAKNQAVSKSMYQELIETAFTNPLDSQVSCELGSIAMIKEIDALIEMMQLQVASYMTTGRRRLKLILDNLFS